MNKSLNVAILIFDDVELLDFAGPYEVFSVANRDSDLPVFNIFTVAESAQISTRGGLVVRRHFSHTEAPRADLLLVPGGVGIQKVLKQSEIMNWVRHSSIEAQLVASVCTGAILLGTCGLLDGLEVTTHYACLKELRSAATRAVVCPNRRFVDTGKVITSAGISAGIDMSLHIVGRLLGIAEATAVAKRMEYSWEDSGAATQSKD